MNRARLDGRYSAAVPQLAFEADKELHVLLTISAFAIFNASKRKGWTSALTNCAGQHRHGGGERHLRTNAQPPGQLSFGVDPAMETLKRI
jgi:hypothetical protein